MLSLAQTKTQQLERKKITWNVCSPEGLTFNTLHKDPDNVGERVIRPSANRAWVGSHTPFTSFSASGDGPIKRFINQRMLGL